MNCPLISIILPVHNGEKYLDQAIESCLNQTYKKLELILVNDYSLDKSGKIIENWVRRDSRVKVVTNDIKRGLPASLNLGHEKAIGEVMTWTSDDNLLKPSFLETLLYEVETQGCDVAFSNYDILWSDGRIKRVHTTGPLPQLIFGNVIGASFLYKKKVFFELGGYDPDLFLVEDYDFFLKASLKFRFIHVNQILYQYRLHEDSLTSKIQNDTLYQERFEQALALMYGRIEVYFHAVTVEFLVKLYTDKSILEHYLVNREIVEQDLMKYQINLKVDRNTKVIDHLHYLIFWNWFFRKDEQNIGNLKKVLFENRKVIIGHRINKKASLRLVWNCLRSGFFKS